MNSIAIFGHLWLGMITLLCGALQNHTVRLRAISSRRCFLTVVEIMLLLIAVFLILKEIGGWGLEADFFKKGFKGLIVFNITTMVKNG